MVLEKLRVVQENVIISSELTTFAFLVDKAFGIHSVF